MHSIKIAYIGGGSRYWARDLMKDLALKSQLRGIIELYDINHAAAERNVAFGEAIFGHAQAKTSFEVRANSDLPSTLAGADFVVLSIEPGPMELRFADLVIPKRYGIVQPVGDTVGPGGLLRALRVIPVYQEFADAIVTHCPQAWVINYTNPMTLCTRALYAQQAGIKAFGCCHEVFGTQRQLANLAKEKLDVPDDIDRTDIKVDVNGVNHFTWVTEARYRGQDLLPLALESAANFDFADVTADAEQRKAEGKWFSGRGLVRNDLTRRFGAIAAAGERHLVEFVPWYARSEECLHRWGVLLTPYEWRMENAHRTDSSPDTYGQSEINPTGEEGVEMMEALVGLRPLDTHVNLPNTGQASQFRPDAVVETNAQFRHGSLKPVAAKPLPSGVAALVRRVVEVQELTLQAALQRDASLAFEALLADPLVTIQTDKAACMFAEMLESVKMELPGWKLSF